MAHSADILACPSLESLSSKASQMVRAWKIIGLPPGLHQHSPPRPPIDSESNKLTLQLTVCLWIALECVLASAAAQRRVVSDHYIMASRSHGLCSQLYGRQDTRYIILMPT